MPYTHHIPKMEESNMPKKIIPLTEMQIRTAKPESKQVTMFDGNGLFLLITSTGGKLWRFKYRYNKKEKLLALGKYPEIGLSDARKRRDEARSQLAHGIDPGAVRKAQKQAKTESTETFEIIAREWYAKYTPTWKQSHAERLLRRLERDVFPYLGTRLITEIKATELLAVLRRVESRGTLDTAHRVRSTCGQVFRYAVATGRCERDPSGDLKGAIPPPQEGHMAAITEPAKVGELLRAIDTYQGSFVVKCALKLLPLLFCRPGELRNAEWSELNFESSEWNIPAHKMKMKQAHLVPLPKQAIAIFTELKKLTGASRYVFPSGRSFDRPMSDNALVAALRRMGFEKGEMTAHGFRATARTILDEVLRVRPDYIEHQLAHAVRDPNGRAYNRTAHLNERRKMMKLWANYLDELKTGAKVIPLRRSTG
jgi:integrase